MKKAIGFISLVGALLIILDSLNAGHGLVLFLFAGVIPGTNLLISPIDMMAAVATAITVVIVRLSVGSSLFSFFMKHVETPVLTPAQKRTHRRVV